MLAVAASCAAGATIPAMADEFHVDLETTETNGGVEPSLLEDQLIVGADGVILTTDDSEHAILGTSGNSIVNYGSVGTSGADATAILMQGDANQVENHGTLMTIGTSSILVNLIGDGNSFHNTGTLTSEASGGMGVRVYGNDGEVHNDGLIQTAGSNASGIRTGLDGTLVVNNGTIDTSGTNAFGMFVSGTNQQIINAGAITTTGSTAHGIRSNGTGFEVFNSGTIEIAGENAFGVYISEDGSLDNSGTITTAGSGSSGVKADGTSTATNTGWIEAQGAAAHALLIQTTGTVVNSGALVSWQGDAIHFSGTDHQLRLEAPSMLIGGIFLPAELSAEAIEVVTGPSHSVYWQLEGGLDDTAPILSGTVPAVYSNSLHAVLTFDPTPLGFAFSAGNALSGAVHGLAATRLDLAPANSLTATHALGAGNTLAGHGEAWIAAFDGSITQDGTSFSLPVDLGWQGIAGGMDWREGEHAIGFMIGGTRTSAAARSAYSDSVDTTSNGAFAALYGRLHTSLFSYDLALAGGWNRYSQTRTVNDNLSETGWVEAQGRYSGWWFAPELAIRKLIPIADGWTLTPALRGRNLLQWADGYTETGGSAAARIGASTQASAEIRGEVSVQGNFELAGVETALGLRGGLLYHAIFGDGTTEVGLDETAISVPRPTHDEGLAGFAAVHAGFGYSPQGRLFVSAETRIRESGFDGVTAAVGLQHRF